MVQSVNLTDIINEDPLTIQDEDNLINTSIFDVVDLEEDLSILKSNETNYEAASIITGNPTVEMEGFKDSMHNFWEKIKEFWHNFIQWWKDLFNKIFHKTGSVKQDIIKNKDAINKGAQIIKENDGKVPEEDDQSSGDQSSNTINTDQQNSPEASNIPESSSTVSSTKPKEPRVKRQSDKPIEVLKMPSLQQIESIYNTIDKAFEKFDGYAKETISSMNSLIDSKGNADKNNGPSPTYIDEGLGGPKYHIDDLISSDYDISISEYSVSEWNANRAIEYIDKYSDKKIKEIDNTIKRYDVLLNKLLKELPTKEYDYAKETIPREEYLKLNEQDKAKLNNHLDRVSKYSIGIERARKNVPIIIEYLYKISSLYNKVNSKVMNCLVKYVKVTKSVGGASS